MIVKIKRNDYGGWSYFECPIINATKNYGKLKDVIGIGENIIIWAEDGGIKNSAKREVGENENINYKRISLETNSGHLRTIITDAVCYILNDNGKTIDKF